MDTLRIIKPSSAEEAFDLRPVSNSLSNHQERKLTIEYEATGNTETLKKPQVIINEYHSKPFIEANTEEINLLYLPEQPHLS